MLKKVEREHSIGNFSHPEIFREVQIGNKKGRFSAVYSFSKDGAHILVELYKYAFISVNKHGKDHVTYSVSSIESIPQQIILGIQERFQKLGIVEDIDKVVWSFQLVPVDITKSGITRMVEDIISGDE